MRRIISVWLPHWPVERWLKGVAPASRPDRAFALWDELDGTERLYAPCPKARALGLAAGMTLAEARAIKPDLLTAEAEPGKDAAALERLARWCIRYSPMVRVDGLDGLVIDATGCAHLFGGEAAMLADLERRLVRAGLTPLLGMASTWGAAHALGHYRPGTIVAARETEAALSGLPVRALRLDDATVLTLNRLGLKAIGSLSRLERPMLARRFRGIPAKSVSSLLTALDRALGRADEPVNPLGALPKWQVRQAFMDPVQHLEAVEHAVGALMEDLAAVLQEAGQGVRRLMLSAFRVDGSVAELMVGTSRASRDRAHLMRLLTEKLPSFDAGFGIDLLMLSVLEAEALAPQQLGDRRVASACAAAELMDRLATRLGAGSVSRLRHRRSHLPERMQTFAPMTEDRLDWESWPSDKAERPLRLLPRPEPLDVMAEVPEGPPITFRWRRVFYRVARAEGPERIAAEWWLRPASHTRDYYRIEAESGARFWLFRHGLYAVPGTRGAETDAPHWYMHGLFA